MSQVDRRLFLVPSQHPDLRIIIIESGLTMVDGMVDDGRWLMVDDG